MRAQSPSSSAADRFRRSVANLPTLVPNTKLGLAVSGGPDSMAMAALTAAAFPEVQHCAAVVDHGLRPDSAQEAETVRQRLIALGFKASVLTWTPPFTVKTRKMERARLARYGLLSQWARANGIVRMWVGHHSDDQAETVALRHEQGTGIEGRRGMDAVRTDADVIYERPLLAWTKAELLEVCEDRELSFVTDPSNSDLSSGRGRIRASDRDTEVPPSKTVIRTATPRGLVPNRFGFLWARSDLLDPETLRQAVAWVRGGHYAPSTAQALQAHEGLCRSGRVALFGCVVEQRTAGWSLIARETRANNPLVPKLTEDGTWRLDDRWSLENPEGSWGFVGKKAVHTALVLPERATASFPRLNGTLPAFERATLKWSQNRAVFSPRRPLIPHIEKL